MASRSILLTIAVCGFAWGNGVTQAAPQAPSAAMPAQEAEARPGHGHSSIFLVFPFENAGHASRLDWLGAGLEELTIHQMAVSGERLLSRDERTGVLEKFGLPDSTRFSRATMLKVAEELDADFVVFGAYASNGKNLKVTAQLLRVSPPRLLAPIEESGALADLMDLHARLCWRLLKQGDPVFRLSQPEFTRLQRPLHLNAFEQYVRGLQASDDEQRIRNLREAARLEPNWVKPSFALGQVYYARRDCDDALVWFTKVPLGDERGPEASFYSAVCYLERNDPTRAAAGFASLVKVTPGNDARLKAEIPEAINNLGVTLARQGKFAEAEKELKRAIRLDPEDADYWLNLALVGFRSNAPASAVEPLRELLRREPDDSEARALLIAALERSGRAAEAAKEREEAASAIGAKPLPVVRAETLARLDRIKTHFDISGLREFAAPGAEASTNGRLEAASTRRQDRLKRARQLFAAGKLADAEREYSTVLANSQRDTAAHQGLADVYRRQGRLDDAVAELQRALEIRDDAAARTTLARLFIEKKKPEEAREQLRLALKLAPGYAEAKELLTKLSPKTGPGETR